MGLEEMLARSRVYAEPLLGRAVKCIDSVVDWCCNNDVYAAMGAASVVGAVLYALFSRVRVPDPDIMSLTGLLFAGLISYFYFHDEYTLRKLGVKRGCLDFSRFSKNDHGKNCLLQLWDSPYENQGAWSIIPAAYALSSSVVVTEGALLNAGVAYVSSYVILSALRCVLHSDLIIPAVWESYASLRWKKGSANYISELEKLVERYPYPNFKLMIADSYHEAGMPDKAFNVARSIMGKMVLPRFSMWFINDHLVNTLTSHHRNIEGYSPRMESFFYLTMVLDELGVDGSSHIEAMSGRFGSVESGLLGFWYYHEKGNKEGMQRHLERVLGIAYDDSEHFAREHFPGGRVFRFSPSHMRDDFVVRVGDEPELRFEFSMSGKAYELLKGSDRYAATEPLFMGRISEDSVLVRSQLRGETLYDCLKSGTAGFDDVVSSWELTRAIHRHFVGIPGLAYLRPSEKLRQVLSSASFAGNAGEFLFAFSEVAESCVQGEIVFNTDGHPGNRIMSGKKIGIIDLQNKGLVPAEYEAANYRYVISPELRKEEDGFLILNGIDPVAYYVQAVIKDLSLCVWFSKDGRERAVERVHDAVYAIKQVKDFSPLFYSRHSRSFERTLSGLSMLEEDLAA
ncbi:hypothetical protein HYU11_01545 [Candidatus Woesearchaeota archaeon]|nr:hypothetical protein [Candidatus Woesearchaeota archaeon]